MAFYDCVRTLAKSNKFCEPLNVLQIDTVKNNANININAFLIINSIK